MENIFVNLERKNFLLEKKIGLLQNYLFDSVRQNLRLLSILELNKSSNSIISLQSTLKLLCYQIQDTIDRHKLAIVIWNGSTKTAITIENADSVVNVWGNSEFPKEIKVNADVPHFSGTEASFEYFAEFYDSYFKMPVSLHDIRIFPLRANQEEKIFGFFIVNCFNEPLGDDEIRLIEACQKQVSQVLQIHHLYEASNIDSLTGLFNRRYAEEKLLFEMKRTRRHGGSLGIMLLDIDHFKNINDTYGHPQGDRVLAAFGHLLLKLLRDIDIPGRWGGEEFLIILPSTAAVHVKLVAERVRLAIECLRFSEAEESFGVSVSIGIASFDPDRDGQIADFLDRADKVLYEAKKSGRNRIAEAH